MRAVVAKRLKEEARLKSLDGSIIRSVEDKKMKKQYTNPHYGQVTVLFPTEPDIKFRGESVKQRGVKFPFK